MLDHENFVSGAIHDPRTRRLGEPGRCGSILGSSSASRWTGRCKDRGKACDARPNSGAARPDPPRQIIISPGYGLIG